jgi:hypothetical protein
MNDLSFEEARRLLRYEEDAGKLYWLPRTPDMFADGAQSAEHVCANWNSKNAGQEAFRSPSKTGYLQGKLNGRSYKAHRVIWLMVTGAWPIDQIDHIDGDRQNNLFCNLRAVSREENMKNMRLPKRNKSGVIGVNWCRTASKWHAQISECGRKKHVGYFDEFEVAVARRKAAEADLGYHPNHGRSA